MHQKKSAFTLIELMVAMGIIGVLVTLSLLGITIVQRSLRDTQRRDSLNSVRLGIEGYYTSNTTYPSDAMVNIATGGASMIIGTGSVALNGPATACPAAYTPSSSTEGVGDASCAIYCYAPTTNNTSYELGVYLEGGWTQLGNAGTAGCGMSDRIPFQVID